MPSYSLIGNDWKWPEVRRKANFILGLSWAGGEEKVGGGGVGKLVSGFMNQWSVVTENFYRITLIYDTVALPTPFMTEVPMGYPER